MTTFSNRWLNLRSEEVDKKEGNVLFVKMGVRTEIIQLNSRSTLAGDISEGSKPQDRSAHFEEEPYLGTDELSRKIHGSCPKS